MALNAETVGYETDVLTHTYTPRDIALYALGIGATRDELDYVFEERGPHVYPTYAVIPTFAACAKLFEIVEGDLMGVVHGAQKIVVHKDIPPSGTLLTTGKVAAIYDLKRLAQSVFSTETRNEEGELLFETEWQIIFLKDGGFGGPRPPKSLRVKAPDRAPDFEVSETIPESQALLYRLSGDLNPLHIDPVVAKEIGFDAPILHGLCTYGYVGRAVINELCDGDGSKLKELRGQFRKPVWPGDTLITRGWKETTDDGERIILRATTEARPDELPFTNAYAVLR